MRNPAEIARMLGWPEAKVAQQPRLRIKRDPITGRWCWWVTPFPTKTLGHAPTHPEALAVGLAALETASVRSQR